MESSLSLAPQGISLITCSPVFSPLSSRAVGILRSEFIASGRNLRLRRRRCTKLRPKSEFNYGKSLFRASLDSQSIVVVAAAAAAAATVSAAAVVYLAYTGKQLVIKQMSGRLTVALSEQIRSMTRWILTDTEKLILRKKESNDRENSGADIKFGEANVIPRGALVVEAPEEFQLNVIAPAVNGCLTFLASEALEISSSVPSVLSENDVPPFVDEVREVHPSAHELSHSDAYELSVPVTQTQLGGSASLADHMQEETDKVGGLNLIVVEESGRNNLDHVFRSSERRELHMVTGASLEKLDNLEQLSSCAILQSFSRYSSLVNMAEGSNLIAQNVVLPIEKLEEERPARYYNQVFLYKQKDSRNQKGPRKTEKKVFHSDRAKNLPPSFHPEQKHDDNKHNPSWQH